MSWVVPATLGLGGALLAAGAVFGVLSRSSAAERDQLTEDSLGGGVAYSKARDADEAAQSRALAANVLVGAGGVAAVAGVVLWLTGGGAEAEEAGACLPQVVPTQGGAVVVWTGATP